MGEVTHEQVNLMLKLYDMRREPVMREARSWYAGNFRPTSLEHMSKLAPMGGKESAYARMVITYWGMVASIVNRGLIDEEFFFENTGEQWMVWERVKPIIGEWRAAYGNPHLHGNLEKHVEKLEAWRSKNAPGMAAAMRQMMMQARPPGPAKSASKARGKGKK
jgi:hypothetical protein